MGGGGGRGFSLRRRGALEKFTGVEEEATESSMEAVDEGGGRGLSFRRTGGWGGAALRGGGGRGCGIGSTGAGEGIATVVSSPWRCCASSGGGCCSDSVAVSCLLLSSRLSTARWDAGAAVLDTSLIFCSSDPSSWLKGAPFKWFTSSMPSI